MALSILEGIKHLLPSVHWDPRYPRLQLLQASLASITSYIFFNRGECKALCLAEDLVVTDDYITLRLREEKGHKQGPPHGHAQHKADRLIRPAESGGPAKGLILRHRHHGYSPHAPMGPKPRRRQDLYHVVLSLITNI